MEEKTAGHRLMHRLCRKLAQQVGGVMRNLVVFVVKLISQPQCGGALGGGHGLSKLALGPTHHSADGGAA